ncbi:MAG: DUF4922 domain-containing protein [Paludibacteraceae bacterium]|nr:DUF4922 domain-containing protein [Paludibacteraceae bacterium]
MSLNSEIRQLFAEQIQQWELAQKNIGDLQFIEQKTFAFDGNTTIVVQHNPARIVSSGAKVDKKSIAERPCFLCEKNRPAEQRTIAYHDRFDISVNPFPIMPYHTTIIAKQHTAQRILPNIGEMLSLAKDMDDFVILYNGPACGASAPDHLHFQGIEKGHLPIEHEIKNRSDIRQLTLSNGQEMFIPKNYLRTCVVMQHADKALLTESFNILYNEWKQTGDEREPMMNIFCWHDNGEWTMCIFPRQCHRPIEYFGEHNLMVSPGAIDMAGVLIMPRKEDYEKADKELIRNIFRQVSRDVSEPLVSVGIMSGKEIHFSLNGKFRTHQGEILQGAHVATLNNGKINLNGKEYAEIELFPIEENTTFDLADVTIGINFHWEQKELQRFAGKLRIIAEDDLLTAINTLPVEDYLKCVISSEMSAQADEELLKAHAVISRSWLLANMRNPQAESEQTEFISNNEIIRWYERNAHTRFDVCADDHCQRYQGLGKANTPTAFSAVEKTKGEVLMSDGMICDARFSKSCGGVSETFENCWADTPHKYLQSVADNEQEQQPNDLRIESNAEKWIKTSPDAFCNTNDKKILSKVLNTFDQSTVDFYRWKVAYTAKELSEIIRRKSGLDFGEIKELIPQERGASGRITRLKIIGEKRSLVVGKELEIRKWLSDTHLYSSAFIVEKSAEGFILTGAGWGHGAGLCQIGAAVMSEKGYKYDQILLHYYKNASIKKIY